MQIPPYNIMAPVWTHSRYASSLKENNNEAVQRKFIGSYLPLIFKLVAPFLYAIGMPNEIRELLQAV